MRSAADERAGDEGVVLVIVLFVVVALSIVIGVVLTSTQVNIANTNVVKKLNDKVYAADSGVNWALQMLQQDPSVCASQGASWSTTQTFDGVSTDVTCTATAGYETSVSRWAVLLTDAGSTSLATQSGGGGTPKTIAGPVYVTGGLSLQADLTVTGGPLYQKAASVGGLCSGSPQPSSRLIATTASCSTIPSPQYSTSLPCLSACSGSPYPMPARGPGATYTVGTCSVFLPGKYTGLNLGTQNYFVSGVYYFENAGTINVSSVEVFGGAPSATPVTVSTPAGIEPQIVTGTSPCATDGQFGVANGSGVEFILGGSSNISVNNSNGTVFELYTRTPSVVGGSEGTAGISIRTVPNPPPAGYVATTVTGSSLVFQNGGGNNPQVAIHGMIYAPESSVSLATTNTATAVVLGGVVAYDLALQTSASVANATLVGQQTLPTLRFVTITSIGRGGGSGKDVTTTVVVQVGNDAAGTMTIASWVTNQT